MFISGLVATCDPKNYADVRGRIASRQDVEIHQEAPEQGKMVLVLCGETIQEEADRFEEIRRLPGVWDLALVVHRTDEEDTAPLA